MVITLSRVPFKRPRSLARSAVALLTLLLVLLRPVCDVFAASGQGHGAAAPQHGQMQTIDAAANDLADHGICCSSIDGHALTVPAIPPLPAASLIVFGAASNVILTTFPAAAQRSTLIARRDPAPQLSYHARSQRRLD